MGNKGLVLVVDDDPITLLLTRQYLNQWGYEAIGIEDGVHVREKAKKLQPGLILLDLQLPQSNGMEILRELKSDTETAPIPVVVCTVTSNPVTEKEMKDLGAIDYWVKPLDLAFFRRTLDQIFA